MHEHADHDAHVEGPAASMDNQGVRPSLIIGIVAVAAAIVFVVQNREKAEIHFLFITVTTSVWVVIVVSLALGVLIDRLFSMWWRRRKEG